MTQVGKSGGGPYRHGSWPPTQKRWMPFARVVKLVLLPLWVLVLLLVFVSWMVQVIPALAWWKVSPLVAWIRWGEWGKDQPDWNTVEKRIGEGAWGKTADFMLDYWNWGEVKDAQR